MKPEVDKGEGSDYQNPKKTSKSFTCTIPTSTFVPFDNSRRSNFSELNHRIVPQETQRRGLLKLPSTRSHVLADARHLRIPETLACLWHALGQNTGETTTTHGSPYMRVDSELQQQVTAKHLARLSGFNRPSCAGDASHEGLLKGRKAGVSGSGFRF